jgi:hypothetical protein
MCPHSASGACSAASCWAESQVYGLALYVEREAASAELARLTSEGFFADGDHGVERMCGAIAQLRCNKVAQVGWPSLQRPLLPRMRLLAWLWRLLCESDLHGVDVR